MYLDARHSFFLNSHSSKKEKKCLAVIFLWLNGGFGRIVQLSPVCGAACWAPIGHLSQQRCPADTAVRVLLLEVSVHPEAAREAVHEILEEVTAEDHVYPGVTAAVETGKERRQSHCCVLRI